MFFPIQNIIAQWNESTNDSQTARLHNNKQLRSWTWRSCRRVGNSKWLAVEPVPTMPLKLWCCVFMQKMYYIIFQFSILSHTITSVEKFVRKTSLFQFSIFSRLWSAASWMLQHSAIIFPALRSKIDSKRAIINHALAYVRHCSSRKKAHEVKKSMREVVERFDIRPWSWSWRESRAALDRLNGLWIESNDSTIHILNNIV